MAMSVYQFFSFHIYRNAKRTKPRSAETNREKWNRIRRIEWLSDRINHTQFIRIKAIDRLFAANWINRVFASSNNHRPHSRCSNRLICSRYSYCLFCYAYYNERGALTDGRAFRYRLMRGSKKPSQQILRSDPIRLERGVERERERESAKEMIKRTPELFVLDIIIWSHQTPSIEL